MPTKETQSRIDVKQGSGRAGVERSEPGGRAERDAGATRRSPEPFPVAELPAEVRDRLSDELVDELLAGARSEEEIVGPGGLLSQLTKRLVERAMEVELTDHWAMSRDRRRPAGRGMLATARRQRRLRPSTGRCGSTLRGIARLRSSPESCASASGALRALTRRSSRCTRAGCRSATSRPIWPTSTASRSATT